MLIKADVVPNSENDSIEAKASIETISASKNLKSTLTIITKNSIRNSQEPSRLRNVPVKCTIWSNKMHSANEVNPLELSLMQLSISCINELTANSRRLHAIHRFETASEESISLGDSLRCASKGMKSTSSGRMNESSANSCRLHWWADSKIHQSQMHQLKQFPVSYGQNS